MTKLFVIAMAMLALAHTAAAEDQICAVAGLAKPAEIIIDEWGVPHQRNCDPAANGLRGNQGPSG